MWSLPLAIQPVIDGRSLTSPRKTTASTRLRKQGRLRHRSSEGDSKSQRLREKLRLQIELASLSCEDRRVLKPEVVVDFNGHSTNIY